MKTIEQLKAQQAAELAALEREIAVAAQCPIPPASVRETHTDCPWVIYKAPSLVQALDIMTALPIVPIWQYRGTFTQFMPEECAGDKDGDIVGGPYAVGMRVSQGRGYGPCPRLQFFWRLECGLVQVTVDLEPENGPGHFWQFGAAPIMRGPRGHEEVAEYKANNKLYASADNYVKWVTGSSDSAAFSYHWIADTQEGGSEYALERLRQLGAPLATPSHP